MDRSKSKAFADAKSMGESITVVNAYTLYRHLQQYCFHPSNCDWNIGICLGKGRKHCGQRRKCCLPAFSPFHRMFSKSFFKVVKSLHCMGKGSPFTMQPNFYNCLFLKHLQKTLWYDWNCEVLFDRIDTLWERQKMRVTSTLFSHIVFKSLFLSGLFSHHFTVKGFTFYHTIQSLYREVVENNFQEKEKMLVAGIFSLI